MYTEGDDDGAYTMEECATAEIAREPCKCLINTGPALEVLGVPVIWDIVLLGQVA